MTTLVIMLIILSSGDSASTQMPADHCARIQGDFNRGALVEVQTDGGPVTVAEIRCLPLIRPGS